jgi:hypothetical protein
MAKPKNRPAVKKLTPKEIDLAIELLDDNDGPMEGPQPLPRIDRRHTPRSAYQTTAWLAPADDTGAIRRPIIRTRDLSLRALGFRTRQDVSALGEAILRLPAATGRYIAIACRVRRSKEIGDGWFDCLVEFLKPEPDLALRHAQLCMQPIRKTSHNTRRRK